MKISLTKARFLLIAVLSPVLASADSVDLVVEGRPAAVIVVTKGAGGCIPESIRELNNHIHKITGTKLKIQEVPDDAAVEMSEVTGGLNAILLGESRFTRKLGVPARTLAAEGYHLKTLPGAVAIVGMDEPEFNMNYDRNTGSGGSLYGTYRLLEHLGVRWFYPDPQLDVIPRRKTLTVSDLDLVVEPYFNYRFAYGNVAWRRKVGFGGVVDPWRTRHTFEDKRIKKRFAASHPEAFREGVHFPHADVMAIALHYAREYLSGEMHPGRRYFGVLPKDAYEGCSCPRCTAVQTPERGPLGAYSDLIGEAVVKVADEVKDLPGKVVYCAYEKYKLPPLKMDRLPRNVVLLIAQSRVDFDQPEKETAAWEIIRSWSRLDPQEVYFCRYSSELLKVTPSFVPRMIARDIRKMKQYRESGTLRIGGELDYGGITPDHPYAWWYCLNEYVTARLLWNPDLNVEALLQDYYDRFGGPASAEMRMFFTRLETLYSTPGTRYLYPKEVIAELDGYLARAKAKVKGTEWEPRVAYIDKGFDHVRIIRSKTEISRQADVEEPTVFMAFDEAGGDMTDDAARGKNVPIGPATWTEGVSGSALEFDGESAVLNMGAVSLAGCDYSISLWMRPNEVTFSRTQYLVGPSAWDRHALLLDNGNLKLVHRHEGQSFFGTRKYLVARGAEFKPGRWYHIVATFGQASGMTIYVDGVLVAVDPALRTPSRYGVQFVGGGGRKNASHITGYFSGAIDQLRIFKRELSLPDVALLYAEGASVANGNKRGRSIK